MGYILELKRKAYTNKSTCGELWIDGVFFCYTLEDVSRGENIKIFGETAIPTGEYKVSITMSTRFKREMPMIYSEPNGYELINKGVSFKGIRLHGGNTSEDSHGCPLIAKTKVSNDHIYGSMEKELTAKLIELGRVGKIIVTNEEEI